MSAGRGVPDWLKKIASRLAGIVAFEVFRECYRRLMKWILDGEDSSIW